MTLTTSRADAFFNRLGVDSGVAIADNPTLPERITKKYDYSAALKQIEINVSPRGIVEGYLSVVSWPDTHEQYRDPYGDLTTHDMFDVSIKQLDRVRKSRNDDYLCPSLYQHNIHELLGGVIDLRKDSKGMIYTAKLALGVRKAQEVFELCKQKSIWASYGYLATDVSYKGKYRVLHAVDLLEQSFVSLPANGLASIISTKHNATTSYPSSKSSMVWLRLQHGSDTSTDDTRWASLMPTSKPTNTLASSSAWASLMPTEPSESGYSDHQDTFSLSDLVDEVQNALQRIA